MRRVRLPVVVLAVALLVVVVIVTTQADNASARQPASTLEKTLRNRMLREVPQGVVGDPELLLYAFPGVVGSGVDTAGVATTVACSSFSGVTETVSVVLVSSLGMIFDIATLDVGALGSQTFSTNNTALFSDFNMQAPANNSSTAYVLATSQNVVCNAMLLGAASSDSAQGIALRGIRFNPVPGTQE